MNGQCTIEIGKRSQLWKDLCYKPRQVSVCRQCDVLGCENETLSVEEIECDGVCVRLRIRERDPDICRSTDGLHIDQTVADCGRFQDACFGNESRAVECLEDGTRDEIDTARKCQTNPAAAQSLITAENNPAYTVARHCKCYR